MAYDYGNIQGPHTWSVRFPFAGGKFQSPVNIHRESTIQDPSLSPLSIDFSDVNGGKLAMKAHNFHVDIEGTGVLRGGPLRVDYRMVQFHFHWGAGNNWGSEHQIDGQSFPCELHCVFQNSCYKTFSEALDFPDGLAVVGVMLKLGNEPNEALEEICTCLPSAKGNPDAHPHMKLPLETLLPRNMSRYYTYNGSLTTPPCSECVTWLVMDQPIMITQEQLNTLRNSHGNCKQCGTTDNYRPVCPLGDRRIRSTFS